MIYKFIIKEKYQWEVLSSWLVQWTNIDEIFAKIKNIYDSYATDRVVLNIEYVADELQ